MDGLQVATVTGAPYERGLAHGESLRPLVHDGIARWLETLGARTGRPPRQHIADFLAATDFVPAIERHTPGLLEEVHGVAVGAGLDDDIVFAYQLADEEWWWSEEHGVGRPPGSGAAMTQRPDGQACSGVAVRGGTENRAYTVMGQNMDLPAHFDTTQAVLRVQEPGSPDVLVLTAAGYLGLTGCNAAGVGLCVNTLMALRRSPVGLPVAFVVRGALARGSVAEARRFIEGVPHASGQNYLIGGPEEVVDLEAGAESVVRYDPASSVITHTNHPMANEVRNDGSSGTVGGALGNSELRQLFLVSQAPQLEASEGVAGVRAVLADRSVPICVRRDPARPSLTFAAVAMELTSPPSLQVAPGPPDETPWHSVEFGC